MKRRAAFTISTLFVVCALAAAAACLQNGMPNPTVTLKRPAAGRTRSFGPSPKPMVRSQAPRGTARPMAASPTVTLPPATTNVGFLTTSKISAGVNQSPYLAALGDFDGNGKQDFASISQDPNGNFWVSVMLSNGDGTFQAAVSTQVTFSLGDLVATGDVNGDGKCDLVLVHSGSADVLLGDGTGNFATAVNYPDSVSTPAAVAVTDVTGDGKLDIVVASATVDGTSNSPVATLVNSGSGTFGGATIVHYPGTMSSGILVDVNGDGHLDLISASQFFLGSGGDFGAPVALSSGDACGSLAGSVAVADVNSDSKLDIVTADCSNGTITVFLGHGDGTFSTGTPFAAGPKPGAVALGDVNGDGKVDVVVSDFYSMDVMVLLGNNDGTFAAPGVGYPAGGNIWTAPLVANFSGHLDVVIPTAIPDQWAKLTYLKNVGDGTFVAPNDYFDPNGTAGTSADSYGIATGDLNGDGLPDFVVGNLSDNSSIGVTVFLSNNTTKKLSFSANYGSGGMLQFVALADIDGDGKLDLVASNSDPTQGNLLVFRGNGNGTFQPTPTSIAVAPGAGLGQLVVGKFDGSNKPDIAVLDSIGNVWVLLNTSTSGAPTFASPVSYALTSTGWEIAAADLGNGSIDLAITQAQSTAVSILIGDGLGAFTGQPDFDLGSFYPRGLALGATTTGGFPDLVVTVDDSDAGMGIAVAQGNGDGTFNAPVLYPATSDTTGTVTPFPAEVRVADLNGDGNPDLIFTNSGDGTVGVLYGTGQSGTGQSPFYAPIEFAANSYPPALLLADINGDGALDAVIGSSNYSGVTTLLNTGANHASLSASSNPSVVNQSVTFTTTVAASPVPGGATNSPTGTVTFTEGTTVLGSGPATISAGQASITTSFTGQGTHVITARYSGDANFVGATLAPLVQNVNASGSPSLGYTLSATPTSATLRPGQAASFTITATPFGGFRGPVSFTCPAPLPTGVSCLFNPPSRNITSASAVTVTLTVTVAPTVVASNSPTSPNSGLPLVSSLVGIAGCVALGGFRRRVRGKLAPVLLLVVLAALLAATGCGGASSGTGTTPGSSAKIIHVMATSSGQGAQQLNITLTIQP